MYGTDEWDRQMGWTYVGTAVILYAPPLKIGGRGGGEGIKTCILHEFSNIVKTCVKFHLITMSFKDVKPMPKHIYFQKKQKRYTSDSFCT